MVRMALALSNLAAHWALMQPLALWNPGCARFFRQLQLSAHDWPNTAWRRLFQTRATSTA